MNLGILKKVIFSSFLFINFIGSSKSADLQEIDKIENNLIYNHSVNANQTFVDQQKQGKRPRFGIMKEIIEPQKIQPVIEANLPIQNLTKLHK